VTAHLSGRIESVTRGTTSMSVSPLCWSRIMEQIILQVTLKHTFQCVTTLCVKSFLLITNLNLPSHFKTISPCPIAIHPPKQPLPPPAYALPLSLGRLS